MRVVGIVAEYNPFHTGHEYHLREAKRATDADYAVVVMSPDFVQRGEPAIFDKYIRTEMALRCGADLVLELPVACATGSAEYFATGAVSLLDASGVTDALCFGAETADIRLFRAVARVLNEEPGLYRQSLQDGLRLGMTFPQARAQALASYLSAPQGTDHLASKAHARMLTGTEKLPDACSPGSKDASSLSSLADFLALPNNILGVEYCRALQRLQSAVTPIPVVRTGSAFNSTALGDTYCSATALRHMIAGQYTARQEDVGQSGAGQADAKLHTSRYEAAPSMKTSEGAGLDAALRYIPGNCRSLFVDACRHPVSADDFLPYLVQKLLTANDFTEIADISPSLSDRIRKLRFQCIGKSFGETVDLLRTKQLTAAHIRRALLHLVLGIRSENKLTARYARILGFRQDAAPLLHELKKRSRIPLFSKPARALAQPDTISKKMWLQDIAASHLYHAVLSQKYGLPFTTEYERSPLRL